MKKRVEQEEWREIDHRIWGVGGKEYDIHKLELKTTFPKKQWIKGNYSIIEPSDLSFGQWELFDGEEIYRFDTLEEAQKFADELPKESI